MLSRGSVALCLFALICGGVRAQTSRQESHRKTIEITATEKISVPADLAVVKLGVQNQASTRDDAYSGAARTAEKIMKALLEAGVPQSAVETDSLRLQQDRELYGPQAGRGTKYSAAQQWEIRCKAADAQKVVDAAVAAGANEIESVEWAVADEKQLAARAYGSALKRAKELAEQTVAQTGLRLGGIVSIINSSENSQRFGRANKNLPQAEMYDFSVAAPTVAMLELQPGAVEKDASVTIVYELVVQD